MTMNIPNLLKLKAWLEAGAPHILFDMTYGQEQRDYWDEDRVDPEDFLLETQQFDKPSCGSVCCIAGAAELMKREEETGKPMHLLEPDNDWDTVAPAALEWLGLERQFTFMAHELFDPDLAPEHCTPAQAAEAVQRVIDGRDPWPEEEAHS